MTKVTAIISTYNAERYIKARFDNLLEQSLYAKGQLEIIVVNSGSRQGERYICREYLDKIVYVESLREPIYSAWNRALMLATGDYITNANTDDRYIDPKALEKMAWHLDNLPSVGVVYADSVVVNDNGEPSDKPPYFGKLAWPEFDPKLMLSQCYCGPCPMWRRSLHEHFGLFDSSFQLAADYEFWLRLAANGVYFKHLSVVLSSFYDNGAGINNQDQSAMESRRAILRWRDRINRLE